MNNNGNKRVVISGNILCRKITQNISRHWSSWKNRFCLINENTSMSIKTFQNNDNYDQYDLLHVIIK